LRFLHVETLGRTFLNVIGVSECGPQRLFDAQAGQQGLRAGAIEQIVRGEIWRHRCDEIDRPLPRSRIFIPQRYVVSCARERDGPCSADEPATDDRDARHSNSLKAPRRCRRR
jgi:hypothetical protein